MTDVSIFDGEPVLVTGSRMSPGAPGFSKSWTADMHAGIVLIGPKLQVRLVTVTQAITPDWYLQTEHTLVNKSTGRSLGWWKVVGVVYMTTLDDLGYVPKRAISHWILN